MPTFEENKHPRDSDGKFTDKDGKFTSKRNKGSKEYRQNTDYKQILEDEYNSELPLAGGVLDKKEYVEEHSFNGSKFANEEADVYHLKDGHKIIFQAMGDPYYQKITPQQAFRVWNKIPDYLKRFAPKEIEFVDYYNPDDPYWQSVYSDFEHSYATSGSKITFWRNNERKNNDDQVFLAMCHEIGHSLDNQLTQTTKYKQEWEDIINKDGGGRVTEYAKNHIREDFAESVALYVFDQIQFKKDFPNRFYFLEKWLKRGRF